MMRTAEAVLFHLALWGHFAALAFYAAYAATKKERFSRTAHRALEAAVGALFFSLLLRMSGAHGPLGRWWYVPWSDWFESFAFFALLITGVFLLVQARTRLPILGAFVIPWSCLSLFIGLVDPAGGPDRMSAAWTMFWSTPFVPDPKPHLTSVWAAIHVPLTFIAYAGFANAFGVGLAYLVQERQMKSRRPSPLAYRLPPLEDMDRLTFRLIAVSYPFLTAGLFLGSVWAQQAWGRWWGWDAKEVWALATWLIYSTYLAAHLAGGWRGRRMTYLSLAGFFVMMFTYVAVNSFSRLHGFLD